HHHLAEVDRNRFRDAALFGFDAGIGRRRVDEHEHGTTELFREAHRSERLPVSLGARVAEVAKDLFLGVAAGALDVADDQHRLPFVVGKAGHDRVIVGEAAVAMDLGEAGEQPLDEVLEAGAIRVPRDLDALPRRQRAVQLRANRVDAAAERLDLAIARKRRRQRVQRVDLFQQRRDRFLEVERIWHYRSSTAPAPTTFSMSSISFGDGFTRICELTSTFTRIRSGPSPVSTSNDILRSPRWREKISPSVSSVPRSAGRFRWIAPSPPRRSRLLTS